MMAGNGGAGMGGAGQGGADGGNGGNGAGKGGMAGGGGMAMGGTSGASGGKGGAGGSGGAVAGCGKASFPKSARYTIESGGMMREYVLDVPANYDSDTKYRLFFTWHWRGGNANNVVQGSGNASRGPYYGLKALSNGTAIFVSPEGLVDNGVTGWANPNGRDIEFLEAMLARFNDELCIDRDRIFSTGFSYGGMMSIAVGCAMGGVFKAVAPMAGAAFSGCESGSSPVAFWGSHAPGDSVVGIEQGRSARDTFVQRNGCDTQTMATTPSGCVSYQGCDTGYPVTWCEFTGDHYTPDFAPQATWAFFSQF
jgi:poly(3-hydroxybutyrate) depolymerase